MKFEDIEHGLEVTILVHGKRFDATISISPEEDLMYVCHNHPTSLNGGKPRDIRKRFGYNKAWAVSNCIEAYNRVIITKFKTKLRDEFVTNLRLLRKNK